MKKYAVHIIAVLFVAIYLWVSQHSSTGFSENPVTLSKSSTPEIVMFGTQSCKYCAATRAFFEFHQLPYEELDIENSDKDMEMFYLLGGKGTPLLIVNGVIIHGFDEDAIRRAL